MGFSVEALGMCIFSLVLGFKRIGECAGEGPPSKVWPPRSDFFWGRVPTANMYVEYMRRGFMS